MLLLDKHFLEGLRIESGLSLFPCETSCLLLALVTPLFLLVKNKLLLVLRVLSKEIVGIACTQ
jgi:hypothetical protein